jgi:hypothetical protein
MRTLQQVLDALAVPGTDHGGVVDYLEGSLKARRRTRGLLGATVAAALLVGGVAVAAADGPSGDEVVADRKASEPRRSTTTEPTTTTTAAATETTIATTTSLPFVPTTIAVPRSTQPEQFTPVMPIPAPAPTTTTTVADRPMTATMALVGSSPMVGDVATFRISWSDPDLPPGVEPMVSLQSGDPAIAGDGTGADATTCATGTQPRAGTVDVGTRYTRAGSYTVNAVVSACGHSLIASTTVTVGSPSSKRAVVVTTSDPALHPETAAKVAFSSDPGDPNGWFPSTPRDPSVRLYHDGAPATVIMLDPSAKGTVKLEFGSKSLCGTVDLTQTKPDETARVSATTPC